MFISVNLSYALAAFTSHGILAKDFLLEPKLFLFLQLVLSCFLVVFFCLSSGFASGFSVSLEMHCDFH